MYQRPYLSQLLSRLSEPPRFIQILAGPRQVGKTTLVRQAAERLGGHLIYATADLPVTPSADWIQHQWQSALTKRGALVSEQPLVLVLDEVQKVPRWSEVVKGLWDARPAGLHLVLLGSSQFLVQQGLTESLAGRFELMRLSHWSFDEMQSAFGFGLDEFVVYGGYPGPAALVRDSGRWVSYLQDAIIEPTVSRDVLSLARIDKPELLRRLMQLGCVYSGQMLSFQKMQGQLQDAGNTTTLANYLHLLSAAWMVTGLQKFTMDAARSRGSSPKLQVFNTALQTALLGEDPSTLRRDAERWGRLIESAVGAHLLNTTKPGVSIGYWRERNREVDFVLSSPNGLLGIEVKSGTRRGDLSGLAAFQRQFPQAAGIVVGTGGIPLEDFLKTPASDWFQTAVQKAKP